MQRPWKDAAYWLALHGFLNLLSYSAQDHLLLDEATHIGLGPPHLLLMKNMFYRLDSSLILLRHFFN